MEYDRETSRLLTGGIPPWYYIPRRYLMVFLGFMATVVCYLLRTNLSVAIIPICKEFNWGESKKGMILSSFFWGYIIPQMPSSWLATKFGAKPVLGVGLLFASLFTIVTPFVANNFKLLLLVRVLTGLSEAVTYPTLTVMVSNWIPTPERSRSIGLIWGGSYIGTIGAMLSGPPLIKYLGWRKLFVVNGMAGVLWACFWFMLASSYPNQMWRIHPYEVEYIAHTHNSGSRTSSKSTFLEFSIFTKLLSSIHIWAIIVANFCNNWGFYILLTWLPTYLDEALKFNLSKSSFLSVLPYAGLFAVSVIAGLMADVMIEAQFNITFVRKLFGLLSTMLPASFLLIVSLTHSPYIAVAGMVCSIAFSGFSNSSWVTNSLDVAPKYAGIITGISNTAGTIPGIVGVLLTGFMLDKWHSWAYVFMLASCVYIFSACFWALFATAKKLF